eukprot:GHVR01043642.1.p1 GENE.GHVR01043642.1~~GHVR01043642.1.p1  ORF type:complete len:431 (+),score=42.18 GHVR01043642.1:308-1600(+)
MIEDKTIPEETNLISIRKIIDKISEKYDKIWVKRKRSINSKFLISFIFQMILNKNKGYGISLLELWEVYQIKNIKTPKEGIFAPSSVCEARQKLTEQIFVDLNNCLILQFGNKKHNIFAVDGSRLNLPKELEMVGYKKCNKEAHYPQGLISCLYNIDTQVVHDFCLTKKLNERDCAVDHLKALGNGDIVIFDRGYFSYLFLYQCKEKGIYPIFRVSVNLQNKEIQNFVLSNETDSIVEYTPASTVKYQIKREGYNIDCKPISLRLIKHMIDGRVYLYATTLIGLEYDKNLFAKLYHKRWKIEELYKISKCLIDVEAFHSKSERCVKQEVYAHFVLINLARFFEDATNIKYGNNKDDVKFNFKNCLNIIGKNIQTIIFKSKVFFSKTIKTITKSIAKIKQKIRPMRKYQRITHKPFNRWVITRSPHWTKTC